MTYRCPKTLASLLHGLIFTFTLVFISNAGAVLTQPPGTVLTFHWHTKGFFIISLSISDEIKQSGQSTLFIPEQYHKQLQLEAVMHLPHVNRYLYRITSLTDHGQAQIFAAGSLAPALGDDFILQEGDYVPIRAIIAYSSQKPGLEQHQYGIYMPGRLAHYRSSQELTNTIDSPYRDGATTLIQLHNKATLGNIDENGNVIPYPTANNDTGILKPSLSMPLALALQSGPLPEAEQPATIVPDFQTEQSTTMQTGENAPVGEPPPYKEYTNEAELLKAMEALKLDSGVTQRLKTKINIKPLLEQHKLNDSVKSSLRSYLPHGVSIDDAHTTVSWLLLAQAFKDNNLPMEKVPVLNGNVRSLEEVIALSAVFDSSLVSTPSPASTAPIPLSPPTTPEHESEEQLRSLLINKPSASYDHQLLSLLHNLYSSEHYHLAENTRSDARISRKVVQPGKNEDNSEVRVYLSDSEKRRDAYHNAAIILHNFWPAQKQRPLPFITQLHSWTGRHLHLTILQPEPQTLSLNLAAGEALVFTDALQYFQAVVTALHDAFSQHLLLPEINPESIVISEKALYGRSHPTEKMVAAFTSMPYSYCSAKHKDCAVPKQDIERHLHQLLQLLFRLRTGTSLNHLLAQQGLSAPAIASHQTTTTDDESPTGFRTDAASNWVAWMAAANQNIEPSELKLIKRLANVSPNWQAPLELRQTINTILSSSASSIPTTPIVTQVKTRARRPAPDHHKLACGKDCQLQLLQTQDIARKYESKHNRGAVGCNAPECIYFKDGDVAYPQIDDQHTMHCSQCDTDWCMPSCARRLKLPGLPKTVRCEKGHSMNLIPGSQNSPTIICDGESCKNRAYETEITHVHHYTCPECYQLPRQNNPLYGFDYCMDCGFKAALVRLKPAGRSNMCSHYGKVKHFMEPVMTQKAGDLCSTCRQPLPLNQYRFNCKCKTEKLCVDCAIKQFDWYRASFTHPPGTK